MYKNSQTTSTKCQYQAAASNPKWCEAENWNVRCRSKQTNKKVVPIITWIPWNPVAIKNVAPYAESEMVKDDSQYSRACRDVKYSPRATVIMSPCLVWEKFLSIIPWWAHVTVTPEARRIIVFKRGTWKGLNGITPWGGHWRPISIDGASLLWKKAQKKEKKNKTSDVINKIIPHRSPLATINVWSPWKAPSRLISRHHWIQVMIKIITPKKMIGGECMKSFYNPGCYW